MKIAFWIWTAAVMGAAITLGFLVPRGTVYSGTDVEFDTSDDRYVTISMATVTMEVADDEFFVLRKRSGEVVVGQPLDVPLGWEGDEYYKFGPKEVSGGQWLVEKASGITVHLSSETTMTAVVTLTPDAKAFTVFLLIVLSFLIWLLGIMIFAH